MVHGIGNDIIEVSRIEANLKKYGQKFLDRIYTLEEQTYCLRHRDAARHFAGRFAAKEAIIKAIGTGFRDGLGWLDIEISNDTHGKPVVNLSSKLSEQFDSPRILITISHCREYATAFALWL